MCHTWRHIGRGSQVVGYGPPVAGQRLCLAGCNYSTLLKWHLDVALLPADCAAGLWPLCGRSLDIFGDHAVSCKNRASGTGTLALNLSSASPLPKPEFRMTAKWMLPGMAEALLISC